MTSEKGIILKKIKFNESDLILRVLNPRGEKVSYIAKAALKSKKRFGGGVLEPTHFVHFSYNIPKKDSETLRFLNEATLIQGFDALRTDYDILQISFKFLNLIDTISVEGDIDNSKIFNLLGNALKHLPKVTDQKLFQMHFESKVLYYLGFLPKEILNTDLIQTPLNNNDDLNVTSVERARWYPIISGAIADLLQ